MFGALSGLGAVSFQPGLHLLLHATFLASKILSVAASSTQAAQLAEQSAAAMPVDKARGAADDGFGFAISSLRRKISRFRGFLVLEYPP